METLTATSPDPPPLTFTSASATHQKAWGRYLAERSAANRRDVVSLYLPLIYREARKFVQRRPEAAEHREDLVAAGVQRLLVYLDRYDPQRRPFIVWALGHLRGAFLDYLRGTDEEKSCRRRKLNLRAAELEQIEQEGQGTLTRAEVDKALQEGLRSVTAVRIYRLDAPLSDPQGFRHADQLPARDELCEIDTARRTAELLRPLNLRSAVAVYLYFVSGQKMRQVGELLGVTESRASQMIAQALVEIREYYAGLS